jgi:hypothetical protein
MNLSLISNDLNVEFYFHPIDIHRSEDEIKSCYFNSEGSIIAVVTKSNIIKFFDFVGKIPICMTDHFKVNDRVGKHVNLIY